MSFYYYLNITLNSLCDDINIVKCIMLKVLPNLANRNVLSSTNLAITIRFTNAAILLMCK